MKSKIENYRTIEKQLRQDYTKLTDFEILSLSIQIERNQILENGLVVSSSDKTPSGLEAIAISLGFTDKQFGSTISDSIKEIVQKMDKD